MAECSSFLCLVLAYPDHPLPLLHHIISRSGESAIHGRIIMALSSSSWAAQPEPNGIVSITSDLLGLFPDGEAILG